MLDTGLAVHLLRRRLGRVLQRSQRRVGSQAEAGDSPAGDREVSLGSEPWCEWQGMTLNCLFVGCFEGIPFRFIPETRTRSFPIATASQCPEIRFGVAFMAASSFQVFRDLCGFWSGPFVVNIYICLRPRVSSGQRRESSLKPNMPCANMMKTSAQSLKLAS